MSADSTDAGREEIRHIRGKIAVQRGPEEFLRRHTRTSSAIRQVTASKSSLAAKKLQDVVSAAPEGPGFEAAFDDLKLEIG